MEVTARFNSKFSVCAKKVYKRLQRWNADRALGYGVGAKPKVPEHDCKGKAKFQQTDEPVDELDLALFYDRNR